MNDMTRETIDGLQNKKLIAWGASKLFELYTKNGTPLPFTYIIDSNPDKQGMTHCGLKVYAPEKLKEEDPATSAIVLFPVSSLALQAILEQVHASGFRLYQNVFLYADLFYKSFDTAFAKLCGRKTNRDNYAFITALTLRTKVPVHTTLLGNVLFTELLAETKDLGGAIAEVGSYSGGNALLAQLWLSRHSGAKRPYYIMDSFEGFPEMSTFDPKDKKRGDYKIDETFESILDTFAPFPDAHVLKGFVPDSFSQLDPHERYSLVFYDCDLYEPAQATYEYFWEKMLPGGFLMVHDYVAEEGGYTGVKKATDEFFKDKDAEIHVFWENTSAVIRKN